MTTAIGFLQVGALVAIAIGIKELIAMLRQITEAKPQEQPAPPRRYPAVFAPLHCGRATEYAGLTEPCGRRAKHQGRCMSEEEIQHVADHGAPMFAPVELRPATSGEDELQATAAEIEKHVDDIPMSLVNDLTDDEIAWLTGLRVLVARANRGADWGGETREQNLGAYR